MSWLSKRRKRKEKIARLKASFAFRSGGYRRGNKALIREAQKEGILPYSNPCELPRPRIISKGRFQGADTTRRFLLTLRKMDNGNLRDFLLRRAGGK
jgi:hypothetical protein